MTEDQRQTQVLLALSLGPIFPVYGVLETSPGVLTYECGGITTCKPGKHPRWGNFKSKATTDPKRIHQWFRRYPNGNFGVLTGPITIAIDADVRPDENGLATLEYLEIDEGVRLPYTVEVVTGRENGSRHFYFKPPAHATIRTRTKVLPGVDVRAKGGYCVAPGSRHIEGGYYRFAEECRPDEQAVAELPDFVLAAIIERSPNAVILGPQMTYNESVAAFDTSATPEVPDGVVLGVLRRNGVARFYWNGGRRYRTASEDDFALACKLAFYCRLSGVNYFSRSATTIFPYRVDSFALLPDRGGCLMKMLPVDFTNDGQHDKEATEFGNQKRIDSGHRGAVSHGEPGRQAEDPRRIH